MRILFLLLASFFVFSGTAQNSPPPQLRFNHLFLKDGLIEGRVHPIVQDNEGYMWMGTHNGLVRYDGYQPVTYLLNGLKQDRTKVADIHVDSRGQLWVGTYFNGLYKYDRPNDTFLLCTPDAAAKPFLQAGEIMNITDDKFGNLWFVLHDRSLRTESVYSFQVAQGRFVRYSNQEKGNQYTAYTHYFSPLLKDKKGNIWCGSDHGLKEFDYARNRFTQHTLKGGNPALQEDVCMLQVDNENPNTLWMAIWSDKWDKLEGIARYNTDSDSFTVYMHPKPDTANAADDFMYGLTLDAKGDLWAVTRNNLVHFDVKKQRFTNYTPPGAAAGLKNFYDFQADPEGNLWLLINGGSINGELAFFNTSTKQFTRYASGGAGDELFLLPHDLYLDPAGVAWFGVGDRGVQWVNKEKSKITLHAVEKGKHTDKQQLFFDYAEAPDGALWFTTGAGLCQWQPATNTFEWVPLRGKKGLQPLMKSTILADKEGNIWSGIISDGFPGLCCYNPVANTTKTYVYNAVDTSLLSSNRFTTILQDAAGDIWMGNYGFGLCRLDKTTGRFIAYPHASGVEKNATGSELDDNEVQCLYEDRAGNIWVGTVWGSLNKLNRQSKTFTSYGQKTPLLRSLLSIFEDSRHNLWAGTYTNGLFLIDREQGTAKQISEKDGLLYNEVQGILEDDKGNLWLKSARGISIYNPQSGIIRNITNELLEDDMLNPLAGKLSNGLFIFSTKGGFVTLNPGHFATGEDRPRVHIERVAAGKPGTKSSQPDSAILRFGKNEIRLRYHQNKVTFNYVGLLYQNTGDIKYKYRLEGFDEDWVAAGTRRTVTYANLPAGRYTFKVMAANSAGLWSTQNDAVVVVITPPFWQTWWFRLLLVIAGVTVVVLAVKAYLNRRLKAQQQEFERQKAVEKVRAKISMDIHDEISSGLTKISLLSQRVKTKYENHREVEPEIIDKIAGSSKDVITNLGEIIWAVNPKHDNLQSLLSYLRNYATGFFEGTPVDIHIAFPEEGVSLVVSPDVKHHLFLVVKEALNNVVKHAAATEVWLHFSHNHHQYTLVIKDNGKGMQHTQGRLFGNGFTNMKKRMEAIEGSLVILSHINGGTELQIKGRFRVDQV